MARDIKIAILGDAQGFSRAVGQANRDAGTLGGKMSGISAGAKVAMGGAATALAAFGVTAVKAGSDLQETLSKSNTVFKENGAAIERWANGASSGFGQSKEEALAAASQFGNMFIQLGIGSGKAATMSTAMTELASDFASFHNADISQVLEAQQAAFRGEYDAVQKFVPTINAAAVEQKALKMGLGNTTKELDAQDKALAVQALLMEGAGDAAGDFDRTSGSLANQQRMLSAQVEDLQAKIGTALIPIVTKVVSVFSDMARWVSENQGKAQVLAAIVGGILTAAFVAWGASVIAATWPIILIGVAVAALVAGVIYAYTHWGWFKDAVDAVARFLTQTLWPALQKVWSFIANNLIPIVAAVIEKYVQFYTKVAEVAVGIVKAFVGVVEWFAGLPGAIGNLASRAWEALKNGLRAAVDWIIGQLDRMLGPLDEIAGKVGGVIGSLGGAAGDILSGIPWFAAGGVVPGAIGQPQLILAHGGEMVSTRGQQARGGSAGPTTINIHVSGSDPQKVVEAVSRYIKSNGQPAWLRS